MLPSWRCSILRQVQTDPLPKARIERDAAVGGSSVVAKAMIGLRMMSRDGPVYAAGPMRGHLPSWLPHVFSDLRSPIACSTTGSG
jgi:hypothetical protein